MMNEQEQLKAQEKPEGWKSPSTEDDNLNSVNQESPIKTKMKELNFIIGELHTNIDALRSKLSPYSSGLNRPDDRSSKDKSQVDIEISEAEEFLLNMIEEANALQTKILLITENFRG